MKATTTEITETTETTETTFSPIEIRLVIETKEELFLLWHRLNLSLNDVIKNSDYTKEMNPIGCDSHSFWRVLNKCVIEKGYRPE